MSVTKNDVKLPYQRKKQLQKVIDILKIGGRSQHTIDNYECAITRFLLFFANETISKLTEDDILKYMKKEYLRKHCSGNTYNLNLSAINFFYSVNFNKKFNRKLLPKTKLVKKLPTTIEKNVFINILKNEKSLKHQCWLLLAYSSGLRANEVASIRIEDIISKEHKLRVLGKRKKERYTVLTDTTIMFLRNYYKKYFAGSKIKSGYLFKGIKNSNHINTTTITNYFTSLKKKYKLNDNISFHSLRHSFASNFIKNGGDQFILKSMLGHTSLNTTSIYIHTGKDFNNLKGIDYEHI